MNRETTNDRVLPGSDVAVPASSPPSIDVLNQKVEARRRHNKIIRGSATGAGLLALVTVTLAVWPENVVRPEPQKDTLKDTVLIAGGDQIPLPELDAPLPTSPVPMSSDPLAPQTRSKIQLYATVSRPVPVFDVDKSTRQIHHVGWANTQQQVPVDMKYVPTQQQEAYSTLLLSDDWDFSL